MRKALSATHSCLRASCVLLWLAACSGPDDPSEVESPDAIIEPSRHSNLQWKRYAALEADLMQALELPADQLCNEFGLASCIHEVHLASLGGNEPFKTGLLEPSAEPLATTPAIVDRLLLSACARRVELDRSAGRERAKVFRGLDLDGVAPPAGSPALEQTITELYHRFLAREPAARELTRVAELADGSSSATEFATLSCFVIGTSTEFLFF